MYRWNFVNSDKYRIYRIHLQNKILQDSQKNTWLYRIYRIASSPASQLSTHLNFVPNYLSIITWNTSPCFYQGWCTAAFFNHFVFVFCFRITRSFWNAFYFCNTIRIIFTFFHYTQQVAMPEEQRRKIHKCYCQLFLLHVRTVWEDCRYDRKLVRKASVN